jgi:cytochrome c-type biogenesis protein CcmH/NrfG
MRLTFSKERVMEKKTFLFLVVGLVIGFAAGATAMYLFEQNQPHPVPPPAAAATPGMPAGMGQTPQAPAMTPEQQQHLEQMKADIAQAEEVLKTDPENLKALIELGNSHYDLKEFKKAISYYQKAVAQDPNNLSVQVDLATAYWYLGDIDKATAGLEAVLKKDPNHVQALNNMGIIMLHGKSDLAGAKRYWTRLVATGTKDIDLESVKKRLVVIDNMLAQQKAEGGQKSGAPAGMPVKPDTK